MNTQINDSAPIAVALVWAASGRSVVPARDGVSAVAWEPWTERAASVRQIVEWWTRWPDARPAVCMKYSDEVAVDLDGPSHGRDGEKSWLGLCDEIGHTPTWSETSRSGNGTHHLYDADGWHLRNAVNLWRKESGIDIRGNGGNFANGAGGLLFVTSPHPPECGSVSRLHPMLGVRILERNQETSTASGVSGRYEGAQFVPDEDLPDHAPLGYVRAETLALLDRMESRRQETGSRSDRLAYFPIQVMVRDGMANDEIHAVMADHLGGSDMNMDDRQIWRTIARARAETTCESMECFITRRHAKEAS